MPDDTFELYDLRVEVVCPEGEKILCGAKKGDYFTLEGEMLYLPPNQGISIYSLCGFHPLPLGDVTKPGGYPRAVSNVRAQPPCSRCSPPSSV